MQLNEILLILFSFCYTLENGIDHNSHFLEELNSEKNWQFVELTDDSISISIKYIKDNIINALKVEKKTNLSLEKIENIIFDIGSYYKVLTNAHAIKTQILNEYDKSKIAHQLIEVDIPFFDNREYIFEINLGSFDFESDEILVYWKILPPDNTNFQNILNKDNISLNKGAGIWKYKPIDKNTNIVQYTLFLDPEGYLPQFIIDMLNKNSMVTLFRDVINHAKNKS